MLIFGQFSTIFQLFQLYLFSVSICFTTIYYTIYSLIVYNFSIKLITLYFFTIHIKNVWNFYTWPFECEKRYFCSLFLKDRNIIHFFLDLWFLFHARHEIYRKFWKFCSRVLEVNPRGYPQRHRFMSWKALSNDILRSKIRLVVKKSILLDNWFFGGAS